MKKYLFLLLLLPSCLKKESSSGPKCYACQVQGFSGGGSYRQDICTDRIDTVYFFDGNRDTLPAVCTEKQ